MFDLYVYGSVQKVRSRFRVYPRRIVIITSLKNNHILDEQLDTTGSRVLQTHRRHFRSLLLFFSRDFWYTRDGYTRTHFVMAGMVGTRDGNSYRLNLHAEHSVYCLLHQWCQTRVLSKSRVTKRFTGREEVGKMTRQPQQLRRISKTHKASLVLIRGPVTSPCLHCPVGCLVASVHKCCCSATVLARSHVFF